MARKGERVPEVLWRLFRSRARTLAHTILALIPAALAKRGDECRCKGRRCLSCSGDKAMSFLVRPDDPPDYRKLLTGCFVVISENAPPLPPVFDPHCRWSQREIVRRSIEMIMHEQPSSSNLICCSYDKDNRSSTVVDTLTSSNWSILLKRVGDAMMMYLLKYTSIFLPLPRKKFHQIAGFPISDLGCKNSRRMLDSKSQLFSCVYDGSRKKRKRVEGAESISEKELSISSLGSCYFTHEDFSNHYCEGSLKPDIVLPKKRTRQYRWQRQRKRRQSVVEEKQSLIPCTETSCTTDTLSRELPDYVRTSSRQSCECNISHCTCCTVFQNEPTMNRNAEIDRQSILYKFENSMSMLPKKHILHSIKPNGSGASVLFNNIFRPFRIAQNPETTPCLHSKNNCPVISTCL